jgi:hypothetical protein
MRKREKGLTTTPFGGRRTQRNTKEERKSPEINADKQDTAEVLPQKKTKNTKRTALNSRLLSDDEGMD